MRPLKIAIEGINSFIERRELDFEAVGRSGMFCIYGKTGAGKSTIFDSIMLALYGRSNKGNLADVVNLSRMSGTVEFEFWEGGNTYRVERTIKCRHEKDGKGNKTEKRAATSECVLYINGEPVAKGEPATERITQMIGLDMSEFKNVYLLEQGEYAEFLKKPPAKQTEAVGKIFSLMRFGDVFKLAGEKKRAEAAAAEGMEERIRDLGEVSQDMIRSAKSELTKMRAKNTALQKELAAAREELNGLEKQRLEHIAAEEKHKAVKAHAERLDSARLALESAQAKLNEFNEQNSSDDKAELERLRGELNKLIELNALDNEYSAAQKTLKAKIEAHNQKADILSKSEAKAAEQKQNAEATYAQFETETAQFIQIAQRADPPSKALKNAINCLSDGDKNKKTGCLPELIFSLKEDKTAYDNASSRLGEAKQSMEKLRAHARDLLEKIQKYSSECMSAEQEEGLAVKEETEAREEFSKAQLSSHAAAVRSELKNGDVCPVCGGKYEGHEDRGAVDLSIPKNKLDIAIASVKEKHKKRLSLEKLRDKAKDDYDRADGECASLEEKIAAINGEIKALCVYPDIYAELSVAIAKARASAEKYREVVSEYSQLEPTLFAQKAEKDAAERECAEVAQKERELKEKIGENCGKTAFMLSEMQKTVQNAQKQVESIDKKRRELTSEVESAKATADAVKSMLEEAVAACPVDSPDFDEEGYLSKRAQFDEKQKEQTELDKDIALKSAAQDELAAKSEKLKILEAERLEHVRRADRYAVIAELTRSKAMLNYVAAEYIEQFTAIASEILNDLSDGKYTMSYDGENGFTVSDYLNGGRSRKTDTLSGGELFLASLSVAIAIARSQSKGNGGFFFLDEGFGTLDDELIDTVYGALESLSKDCLVGVISHAGALIDRMPSCVEVVEASDTEGSLIRY